MPERDSLDLLLDDALCTYGEASAGIEQRVLAHVAQASATVTKQHLHRVRLAWALALPIAACLIVFLFLPRGPRAGHNLIVHTPPAPPAPPITRATKPVPSLQSQAHISTATKQHLHRVDAAVALPKLGVFPTPTPLTPQEQALVRFAVETPKPELHAIVQAQNQISEPLHVAAIQIPQIEPSRLSTSEPEK